VAGWWLEKVFPIERRMMAAARPLARAMLDISLPTEKVFDDVERLVQNLVAMNGILRDRATTSVRLVMNPDRMVIKESMRTFTYLNLYGYLTDAVIVNRVFPEEVDGGYFENWRAVQQEQMELVRSAFAPVPILVAPYFAEEVIGEQMLERLASEIFQDGEAGDLLHEDLAQELATDNGSAVLRLPIPFVEKADIGLKKIGLEVIVRVGGQKRTIILPASLAAYRPRSAQFEDGALSVRFERSDDGPTRDEAATSP
jgi:arsenite-transporting ATPase